MAEEAAESTKQDENEITIFAKIGNIEGLKQAVRQEGQIQIEARLGAENHCRVRRTDKAGEVGYMYTFKLRNASNSAPVASKHEFNLPVDEDFFNGFKQVADKEQNKTRYIFESEKITLSYKENDEDKVLDIPDVIYEVDVFKKADGTICEWCKIDVEIDQVMQFLEHNHPELKNINMTVKITHLPFEPKDSFICSGPDDENHARVAALYEHEFCIDLLKQRLEDAMQHV